MKNKLLFEGREEIKAKLEGLWRTDIFRNSTHIGRRVELVANTPIITADIEYPEERSHFLVLLGVIPLRPNEYKGNPYIGDLYLLHELEHFLDLVYSTAGSEDVRAWVNKIWENECTASLATEVTIYFEIPELRARTFGMEIWADRFLENRQLLSPDYLTNQDLFNADKPEFMRLLEIERKRVMVCPSNEDDIEQSIHKYSLSNQVWAEIWQDKRVEVEASMVRFRTLAITDRKVALDFLNDWLEEIQQDQPCPYYDLAKKFSDALTEIFSK